MQHLEADVQKTDGYNHRRFGGQQRADDHAADQHSPDGQDEGLLALLSEYAVAAQCAAAEAA
jgi:hypothetical protein